MESKIFALLLSALIWTDCAQSQLPDDFSCETVSSQRLNLTALAGYWFEAVRVPNVDVMKCLNVSVPATVDHGLELQLEYVNTVDKRPLTVKETISFPWDDATANGLFNLEYITELMNISVTYKLVYAQPKLMAILCGYSSISPMPLFKIFTRQRQLDPIIVSYITKQLDKTPYGNNFHWTEQSPDRCNAAVSPKLTVIVVFGLAIICSLWS
ncbi:uncharacterized protein LOC115766143 [Drosophila novamexicana]|uniref:uncharacterized protein LOC115766143 n=1 Tax=Drosophila novamexicana TaxID=47314 RepID=UPI0011E5FB45|nr:uncharacterized protein LOC115766143 [Drosophila novamexicana]